MLQKEISAQQRLFNEERLALLTRHDSETKKLQDKWRAELHALVAQKDKENRALKEDVELCKKRFDKELSDKDRVHKETIATLEASFAESKTRMMLRMQEEFQEGENAAADAPPVPETRLIMKRSMKRQGTTEDDPNRKILVLEESLEGQRKGFVAKMNMTAEKYEQEIQRLTDKLDEMDTWCRVDDLPERIRRLVAQEIEQVRTDEFSRHQVELEKMGEAIDDERRKILAEMDKLEEEKAAEIAQVGCDGFTRQLNRSPPQCTNAASRSRRWSR